MVWAGGDVEGDGDMGRENRVGNGAGAVDGAGSKRFRIQDERLKSFFF